MTAEQINYVERIIWEFFVERGHEPDDLRVYHRYDSDPNCEGMNEEEAKANIMQCDIADHAALFFMKNPNTTIPMSTLFDIRISIIKEEMIKICEDFMLILYEDPIERIVAKM